MKSEKIEINIAKTLLTGEYVTLKTDYFNEQTKNILLVDFLLLKISQNIISKVKILTGKFELNSKNTFNLKIDINDSLLTFFAKIDIKNNEKQFIFYNFINNGEKINLNDTRIKNYLNNKIGFSINVCECVDEFNVSNKTYRVLNTNGISFPSLNKEQLEIVNKQDENIVVQGVAGSGKTNVCVEKLIWSCSKNYGGKILYSTFSQGLLIDTKLKIDGFKNCLVSFVTISNLAYILSNIS